MGWFTLFFTPGHICAAKWKIQEADEWLYGRAGYLHGCLFFQALKLTINMANMVNMVQVVGVSSWKNKEKAHDAVRNRMLFETPWGVQSMYTSEQILSHSFFDFF